MAFQFTFDSKIFNSKPVTLLNIFVIIYAISIILRVVVPPVGLLIFAGLTLYILYLVDKQFDNAWATRQALIHRIEQLESKLGVENSENSQKLKIN